MEPFLLSSCSHSATTVQNLYEAFFFLFLQKCMVFFQNFAHWYSTWHLHSRITNNMFHLESCFKKLRHLRKIRHKAGGLKLKSKETKENQKWVIQKSRDTRSGQPLTRVCSGLIIIVFYYFHNFNPMVHFSVIWGKWQSLLLQQSSLLQSFISRLSLSFIFLLL